MESRNTQLLYCLTAQTQGQEECLFYNKEGSRMCRFIYFNFVTQRQGVDLKTEQQVFLIRELTVILRIK